MFGSELLKKGGIHVGACCHCKGILLDASPKDIAFEYDGLRFSGRKRGLECSSCVMKAMKARYEALKQEGILKRREVKPSDSVFEIVDGVPYYRVKEEGIEIDWTKFRELQNSALGHKYKKSIDAVQSLVEINILSYDIDEHYIVITEGVITQIHDISRNLFFARGKDAKDFAEMTYGIGGHDWAAVHCQVLKPCGAV